MTYDVLIIGGGPGGIYTAWELLNKRPDLKLALFESGHTLERRRCPIDGVKVKSCVHCPTCAIMNGFGGAGAFSDGKYNITNQFGGTLHEHIGKKKALELMEYVDQINMENGGEGNFYAAKNMAEHRNVGTRYFLQLFSVLTDFVNFAMSTKKRAVQPSGQTALQYTFFNFWYCVCAA